MISGIDYTGVSVVFMCHDGKGYYLFNKRGRNCRDEHGVWDPGGGSVDFNADIEETLKREIHEEYCTTVLSSEFLGYLDIHRKNDNDQPTHWVALVFTVLVDRLQVRNGEPHKFDDIQWFSLDHLPTPLHSQFPRTLKMLKEHISRV